MLARGMSPAHQGLIVLVGVFAPSLVAIAITWLAEGTAGVVALLRRLIQWRVAGRWDLLSIGYMAGIKIAVALIFRVTQGVWPQFGTTPIVVMFIATILSTVMLGQAGEEIGWRGFALPHLGSRIGLAWASVLLGAIWAVWHLPLFFWFPGADTYGQSFPLYALQVTALSVAIAYVWMKSNGSLLLTMLMHSAVNNTKDIVPSAVPGATNAFALSTSRVAWMTVALMWLCALYFLWALRKNPGGGTHPGAPVQHPRVTAD